MDHEQVAEQVADEWYHQDPDDPYDFEFDVEVKDGENGEIKKFSVTAEAQVHFSASEVID